MDVELVRAKSTVGSPLLGIGAFLGVYALFDVLPIILPKSDVIHGLRWGDLVDAPLAFLLVAAYVLLGLQAGLWRSNRLRVVNAVALVLLVQGHGIHLAANTISAYLDPSSPGWRPAYFLDEHWGHLELQLGILLAALIFIVAARNNAETLSPLTRIPLVLLACTYGLFLTADAIEGQTVPLMVPAGVTLALVGFLPRRPFSVYRSFFASAFATTVLALAAYGLWHGGFPEHDWHVWQYILVTPGRCC